MYCITVLLSLKDRGNDIRQLTFVQCSEWIRLPLPQYVPVLVVLRPQYPPGGTSDRWCLYFLRSLHVSKLC